MGISVLQGVRQDFQKYGPEQGADGVGNEQGDATGAKGESYQSSSDDAEGAAKKADENDPAESGHGKTKQKRRIIRFATCHRPMKAPGKK